MDFDKSYVGKVVRFEYTQYNNPQNNVGYVFDQKSVYTPMGAAVEFSVCLTNGNEWYPRFTPNEDLKISSVRMDKSLRDALKAYGDARSAQNALLTRFEAQKRQHNDAVNQAKQAVKAASKDMSMQDMIQAVEALFKEAYPSSGDYYLRYFDCTSCSSKEITMTQIQDVEKWATPEKYSFLYREYDGNLSLYHDRWDFRDFCKRNAPAIIPALKGYKSHVGGSIGDKNWLSVGRSYVIPLKHGLTKDSLQDIKDVLSGKTRSTSTVKKPSLDSAIKSASSRTVKKTPEKPDKAKDKER